MQIDEYLKLISNTNISKDIELEKETKSKSSEKESTDTEIDEFLQNLSIIQKHNLNFDQQFESKRNFHFGENAFPTVHFDIQIPPPRA